jgi:caspase domain-containing protein
MTKRALVVGVDGYGFPNDLPNCTRDADAFGNVLETIYRFDDVRVVNDAEATKDGVERALDWLVQGVSGNDRLVFYFSGHGCRIERGGVLEEALVLQDGRLLADHDLAERLEHLPAGILTVLLDCCFSGLDEMLVHPSGQVEVARAKRWIAGDLDRGRLERTATPGSKAFTPFGHVKPAPLDVMAAHLRSGSWLDASPARLVTLAEPRARALLVAACLGDETTLAGTTQAGGLSPFTYCLLNEIKRLGPNRSTLEILQATGHELRRLGLRQTPLVEEPIHPERLSLRAFLTFQPVFAVYPPSTPGHGSEEELTRSVAEAVRRTIISMKEGRTMQAPTPGTQMGFEYQPYGGFAPMGFGAQGWPAAPGWPSWPGAQGWPGGFGQRAILDEIAPIVAAAMPVVLANLQSRQYQPYLPGFLPQAQYFQGFQRGLGGPGFGGLGGYLQPHEIAQIVSAVTPIVASLVQSRSYQGHFGQYLPRAA